MEELPPLPLSNCKREKERIFLIIGGIERKIAGYPELESQIHGFTELEGAIKAV